MGHLRAAEQRLNLEPPEALNGTLGTGHIEQLVDHVIVSDDHGCVHSNGLDATQIVQRIEDKWDYVVVVIW